jgi:thiosulfate/3-mercaptopyruvate sulfurtransferase
MRPRTPLRRIGVEEARALLGRSEAVALDVRDPDSFHRGHIESAHNVSMANLDAVIPRRRKGRRS